MVLTFTGSISVAEGAATETRTVLAAAIGCNLAWGIVDGAMYLIAKFTARARDLATFRAIRSRQQDAAHQLILDALPPVVSATLTPIEVETMRNRLNQLPEPSVPVSLNHADVLGGVGVFLLVFLS